jgi:hypothetical protein
MLAERPEFTGQDLTAEAQTTPVTIHLATASRRRKTAPGRQPPAATRDAFNALAAYYCCGEFSTWALQAFFASLFDSLGWLACSEAMQSFICCLWDLLLLWLLLIPLLLEVEVEGELLGYAVEGGDEGEFVCAATIPAAINAARAKDPANGFMGSSKRLTCAREDGPPGGR